MSAVGLRPNVCGIAAAANLPTDKSDCCWFAPVVNLEARLNSIVFAFICIICFHAILPIIIQQHYSIQSLQSINSTENVLQLSLILTYRKLLEHNINFYLHRASKLFLN